MKSFSLLAGLAGIGLPIFAIGALGAPASTAHIVVRGHTAQLSVPAATEVQFAPFTVTVPRHWGFQARVEPKPVGNDQMTIDFITAPGRIKTSKIYVGVRESGKRHTMQQIRKNLASEKGHHFRTVSWNGQNWILDEFQGVHPHTTVWTAYLVRGDKEYLMLAESPNKQRPRFEHQILGVMKSVRFSAGSAQAEPAPVKPTH